MIKVTSTQLAEGAGTTLSLPCPFMVLQNIYTAGRVTTLIMSHFSYLQTSSLSSQPIFAQCSNSVSAVPVSMSAIITCIV